MTDARVADYRLTTAEILYRLPDFPDLLQVFLWQKLDVAPEFPVLHGFLEFWQKNIDGAIHSVRVDHVGLLSRRELRHVGTEFRLH
jgi:uncharacterized protein Usg